MSASPSSIDTPPTLSKLIDMQVQLIQRTNSFRDGNLVRQSATLCTIDTEDVVEALESNPSATHVIIDGGPLTTREDYFSAWFST